MNRSHALLSNVSPETYTKLGSLLAAFAITIAAILANLPTSAEAKTPGSTYCFYGKCHRVKSIAEIEAMVGTDVTLAASFYDSCARDRYNPCGLTSSGEPFFPDATDNAASPIYPDGTRLLVWSPDTLAAAVIRVNNAGPYWGNRQLDVSRATASALGFAHLGVANLKVRIIDAPTTSEATYQQNRRYEPVAGFIGRYASLAEAHTALARLIAVEAIAGAVRGPVTGETVAIARTEIVRPDPMMLAQGGEGRRASRQARLGQKAPVRTAKLNADLLPDLLDTIDLLFSGRAPSKAKAGPRAVAPAVIASVPSAVTPALAAASKSVKKNVAAAAPTATVTRAYRAAKSTRVAVSAKDLVSSKALGGKRKVVAAAAPKLVAKGTSPPNDRAGMAVEPSPQAMRVTARGPRQDARLIRAGRSTS